MATENLSVGLYASAAVLLVLAIFTTALRVYARTIVVRAFGTDDWLMLVTLFLFSIYCFWVFWGTSFNQGRHTKDLPPDKYTPALLAFYFGEVFYVLTAWFLKLSLGAFLLRLHKSPAQRWTVYITLAIISVYSVAFLIMAIFQCKPVDHYWHPLSEGTCFKPSIVVGSTYAYAGIISFSDFLFAVMPIFLVWHLQMNTFMKVTVAGLMSLGAIAGVTTIVRVVYIKDIGENKDFFYNTAKLTIWSTIEPGVGIIIGSLAALRPLFKSLLGKHTMFSSSNNKYGSTRGRKNTGPWQSTHDTHFQLQSLKGLDDGIELHTTKVEGGRHVARTSSKKGRTFGSVKISSRNDSQEELTPQEGNIYKEISVERSVEVFPQGRPSTAADRV
ncbi:integral membrane protein [Phlyctema vagabunda]|uniref:Integral membrane protein n=1 Tax=Phlyctema vagabunda TaxID=108571 RepID=A0ABR4P7H2_9HELO